MSPLRSKSANVVVNVEREFSEFGRKDSGNGETSQQASHGWQGIIMNATERRVPRLLRRFAQISILVLIAPAVEAREITDMAGRHVTIPDRVEKVVSLAPPVTHLVYAIDPALLAGVNFPLWDREKRFTAENYRRLPVIGGRVGTGRTVNLEVIARMKPDLVLFWSAASSDEVWNQQYEAKFAEMGIPCVRVYFDKLHDIPRALRFVGEVLGRAERGRLLEAEATTGLAEVEKLASTWSEKDRVSVFYAEDMDCLATDGAGSWHEELIPMAGGRNVHASGRNDAMGRERISVEKLLVYDPEAMVIEEPACKDRLETDDRLRSLRAVRDHKLFLIPRLPFNWFDRPPSFMRLLGLRWLTNKLHPGRYPLDIAEETRKFYHLYLGVDLTPAEVQEVLGLSNGPSSSPGK